MNPFALPEISIDDLRSYREDLSAMSRFERRFSVPCQVGFLSAFGGIVSTVFLAKGALWPIPFIVAGLLLVFGGLLMMWIATPRSISGQPMKKYWNRDTNSKGNEVIYVCDDSKTFFRRTWAKKTRAT